MLVARHCEESAYFVASSRIGIAYLVGSAGLCTPQLNSDAGRPRDITPIMSQNMLKRRYLAYNPSNSFEFSEHHSLTVSAAFGMESR